uniref:Peptidase S1 domain-containing protein n=1 Tax=Sparus aurata TaxID=8175 RepID=A0A671VXE3_SPAAU
MLYLSTSSTSLYSEYVVLYYLIDLTLITFCEVELTLQIWQKAHCRVLLDLQKRIMGGHDCTPNERLYHVRLTPNDGTDDYLCGGSLISKSWILTAGHCWEEGWTIEAEIDVHPGPGRAVQIRERPVKFIDNQNRTHDIMLLKLPKHTQINHTIPLPKSILCSLCKQIKHKSGTSPILQCADFNKVNCPLPGYEHVFCGSGDSGGGVVFNGMIYGVHESSFNNTCPRISEFMDVCEYMDWIRRITGIH